MDDMFFWGARRDSAIRVGARHGTAAPTDGDGRPRPRALSHTVAPVPTDRHSADANMTSYNTVTSTVTGYYRAQPLNSLKNLS